jgi:hypothetical protein
MRRLVMTLGLALVTAPAHAYVRATTATGHAVRWARPSISIDVYLNALDGVTDAERRAAVEAAARAWSADETPCTAVRLSVEFRDGAGPAPANDGENVLGARDDGWCPPDAAPPAGASCHPPSAAAATTTSASAADGRLFDGDTELNTLTFSWAALDGAGEPHERQDLQSAVTHELGHVLGFDHPCWSGVGPRARDDRGAPVPDCYGAPPELARETMFPSTEPGDVSRRALTDDARRGLCEVYPAGEPTAAGCALARSDPWAAALALLFAATARSRAARRASRPSRCP